MVLRNWLKRFVSGDPICKVADTRNLNRIANVIEDLEVEGANGINATITKPTDAEGLGWRIDIDGRELEDQIEVSSQHFGNAEDAETASTWKQSDETPAILEITSETKCKVLVDSRGNIISWTASDDGDEPDTPTPPTPPPTCGNPLNDNDDSNPLDRKPDGGGGGGSDDQEDHNPLNYEGDGGFTPSCGGEAA